MMTARKMTNYSPLDRLTDALVEDILALSDEEILAEAQEDGIDVSQYAADMRSVFSRIDFEQGKTKLAIAREEMEAARASATNVVRLDHEQLRARYKQVLDGKPALAQELTMAARKGDGQSEKDHDQMIEDLLELGALDSQEDEKPD